MNQTNPPVITKKNKKFPTWIIVVGVIVVLLGLQYIVQGPAHGDKQVARIVEQLQQDSAKLNGDLSPIGTNYTNYHDISKAVDEIYDLGRPTRYNSTDSAFFFSNEKIAPIAKYNQEKCKEVLSDVLPQWRRTLALALNTSGSNPPVVCRIEGNNDTILSLYSLRYLDADNIKSDYLKYLAIATKLGFKELRFAPSPNNAATTYEIK